MTKKIVAILVLAFGGVLNGTARSAEGSQASAPSARSGGRCRHIKNAAFGSW